MKKMIKDDFDLNPNGENVTKRITSLEAEKVLYSPQQCLDHGFVRLVDYMGTDESIVQSARVSYGKGTKTISEDRGLIRYLMRHRHTTPFEMVELKFHAKMPIFVARQWIRHRTASVNEYSGRYSILDKEFYVPNPEDLSTQSKSNRQGRDKSLHPEETRIVLDLIKNESERDYQNYEFLLNEENKKPGQPKDQSRSMLARELARMGLGLNFYTQWYWKIDLHNLFHFLGLRMDKHAQKEIRVYADSMADITKKVAPLAFEAFEDYRLNGMSLSSLDIDGIRLIMAGKDKAEVVQKIFGNKREKEEFLSKLEKFVN